MLTKCSRRVAPAVAERPVVSARPCSRYGVNSLMTIGLPIQSDPRGCLLYRIDDRLPGDIAGATALASALAGSRRSAAFTGTAATSQDQPSRLAQLLSREWPLRAMAMRKRNDRQSSLNPAFKRARTRIGCRGHPCPPEAMHFLFLDLCCRPPFTPLAGGESPSPGPEARGREGFSSRVGGGGS